MAKRPRKSSPSQKLPTPKAQIAPAEKPRITQSPMRRMLFIHDQLQAEAYPNSNWLAEELECHVSSIRRDVEHMRSVLGLKIGYDQRRYGYYYMEKVTHFPLVKLTDSELIALCVAQHLVSAHKGAPFAVHLRSAFEKINYAMQDEIRARWDNLASAFSVRTNGCDARVDVEAISQMSTAVLERKAVEFAYLKLGAKQAEQRQVHPMHLTLVEQIWYLLAFDPKAVDYRTFALPRLSKPKETGETFERRADFDPEKLLENSIGIYKGTKPVRVRLLARGITAHLLAERSWHPSQKVKPVPESDGEEVEVTMKVAITPELEHWILGRGMGLRVLEPESLRVRMREVLGRMASEYEV